MCFPAAILMGPVVGASRQGTLENLEPAAFAGPHAWEPRLLLGEGKEPLRTEDLEPEGLGLKA